MFGAPRGRLLGVYGVQSATEFADIKSIFPLNWGEVSDGASAVFPQPDMQPVNAPMATIGSRLALFLVSTRVLPLMMDRPKEGMTV